jgi:hypothetical protein
MGNFDTELMDNGHFRLLNLDKSGKKLFLIGKGYLPESNRPFLDEFDIATFKIKDCGELMENQLMSLSCALLIGIGSCSLPELKVKQATLISIVELWDKAERYKLPISLIH